MYNGNKHPFHSCSLTQSTSKGFCHHNRQLRPSPKGKVHSTLDSILQGLTCVPLDTLGSTSLQQACKQQPNEIHLWLWMNGADQPSFPLVTQPPIIAAVLQSRTPARRTDASFPCSGSAGSPLSRAEINHGELAVTPLPSRTSFAAAAWLAGVGMGCE